MNPDICIIQECEKLKEDYFPNAKFFWTGRIENKGLGVLIKNESAFLDPIYNPNLINFIPIRIFWRDLLTGHLSEELRIITLETL